MTNKLKQEAQIHAELFHDTYERLAPSFGYETREDTKLFDPESKNGKLMMAVCKLVIDKALEATAKAYGGCTKCYGKGYATVAHNLRGSADFIGDPTYLWKANPIKTCSCDRGKQIEEILTLKDKNII